MNDSSWHQGSGSSLVITAAAWFRDEMSGYRSLAVHVCLYLRMNQPLTTPAIHSRQTNGKFWTKGQPRIARCKQRNQGRALTGSSVQLFLAPCSTRSRSTLISCGVSDASCACYIRPPFQQQVQYTVAAVAGHGMTLAGLFDNNNQACCV